MQFSEKDTHDVRNLVKLIFYSYLTYVAIMYSILL